MLTSQQMTMNTCIKPQHTWAKYKLIYTELNLSKQSYFSLVRTYLAMTRSTSAQRRPSRTVSRASIVSFCQRHLTQQTFRYGQEAKTATRYSCRVRYLDGNAPFATFIFKYRDAGLYIYLLHRKLTNRCLQVSCKLMA